MPRKSAALQQKIDAVRDAIDALPDNAKRTDLINALKALEGYYVYRTKAARRASIYTGWSPPF